MAKVAIGICLIIIATVLFGARKKDLIKKEDLGDWANIATIVSVIGGGLMILLGGIPLLLPSSSTATSVPPTQTPIPPISTPSPTPWPLSNFRTPTDDEALCTIKANKAPQAGRENAVKITYDFPPQEGYCSWVIPLDSYDASTKTTLTFWVKGEIGGEQFEVGVKSPLTYPGQEPKIRQTAARTWTQVSIPLDQFKGQDLTSLENFSLGFRHDLGSGTIYVADFVFNGAAP
jgi:hypothetical protein